MSVVSNKILEGFCRADACKISLPSGGIKIPSSDSEILSMMYRLSDKLKFGISRLADSELAALPDMPRETFFSLVDHYLFYDQEHGVPSRRELSECHAHAMAIWTDHIRFMDESGWEEGII